ncbi:NAD dependent epimerase/dehydratase family, putative [Trypanosoma equiperdum]|uniref:NAD-dependent epimerase/dehydratase domain-containing protein n=2 Tax=Trypanozoon TaxID=39700 RepID=Q581S7_TRYB2|nr:hypothetical protein, conserved [Trypanosoma brucei brucei TREU927]AAX79893.1 hypothetical protein, conserved [Trypanosoma brucei]AAZ10745.1 hypothetical protein, conserved [Trypanosoma brucei brucei TREU927]SCU67565.1 NAD dependent epimerase/dehydratase family, putative [Trypanosoma equiperdum]
MLRVFSGSCLSLEHMETVRDFNLVKQPHVLGPGADYFTEDGQPVRPQPCAHTLHKVFSGSTLDLNAACGEILSDEDVALSNGTRGSPHRAGQQGQQQQPKIAPGATVSTILSQLSSETEKERAKSLRSKTVVLIVGGVGYVSSHVVNKALEAGYSVRITGSGALTPQQQAALSSVGRDHEQRLSIFEADMTNTNSLRDALRGCKYVIHCGCPVSSTDKDTVEFHLSAVQALFNAIRQAGKSTVKRVVIHGAASSVFHVTDPEPPSGAFDESCWNSVATNDTDPIPYARIYFEKEAWRLKQMLGVELVVILPSITIGPSRTEEVSDAMKRIQHLATASSYFPYAPNLHWNFVDVRDVAEAHVRALECQEVKDQRVIVSGGCFSFAEIGKLIRNEYPHLTPPTRTANTLMTLIIGATHSQVSIRFLWRTLGVRKCLDTRKATTELGMKFTPMQETLRASIEQMISAGELPPADGSVNARSVSRAGLVVTTMVAGLIGVAAWIVVRRRGKN